MILCQQFDMIRQVYQSLKRNLFPRNYNKFITTIKVNLQDEKHDLRD